MSKLAVTLTEVTPSAQVYGQGTAWLAASRTGSLVQTPGVTVHVPAPVTTRAMPVTLALRGERSSKVPAVGVRVSPTRVRVRAAAHDIRGVASTVWFRTVRATSVQL